MNPQPTLPNLIPLKEVLLFLCALMLCARCLAYPIEPVGLRELVLRSDLIVLAVVEPVPPPPKSDPNVIRLRFLNDRESPARLRATSVLKGAAPNGLIEVHFEANMICPSPPRFPEGKKVLAFLRGAADGKGYNTVGLSYGAKEVSEAEATAYSERISDWLTLDRQHASKIPTNAVVEWLVKCAENPLTKWEGTHELSNRRLLLGTNTVHSPFAPFVTPNQTLRLSNVVFSSEYITSGDFSLLEMFRSKARSRVVQHLVGCLQRASSPVPPVDTPYAGQDGLPEPWNTFDAMWLVAELLEDPASRTFVGNLKRTDFFSSQNRVNQLKNFLPGIEAAARSKGYLK
jgi:hypothetical protein